MEVIIFIAAIIGLIAKVLKTEGQPRQQTNTGQNIPRSIQGRNITTIKPVPGYNMQRTEPAVNPADYASETIEDYIVLDMPPSYTQAEVNTAAADYGTSRNPDSRQTVYSGDISKPLQVIHIDSVPKQHKLDFSRDSLINGFILSEVLGPPKCRR